MQIHECRYASPLGDLLLAWNDGGLVSLDYENFEDRYERLLGRRFPSAERAASRPPKSISQALDRYFAGDVTAVDAVAVEYNGTDFENRVWQALRTIGPGVTATYGEMATSLEVPKAARAVGRANSMNPVAIVVPCHRVIGANTKLTGYAGGLDRKQWLLDHERKHAANR